MRYFSMSQPKNKHGYRVAVVGATGVVGQEMITMLEKRNFPVSELRLLASERSAGKALPFKGSKIQVEVLNSEAIHDLDIAIFSAGSSVSKEFAPIFSDRGIFVVD